MERHSSIRAFIWTICSATALITTKRLMFTYNYHYPLTIAFNAFGAILIAYIISLCIICQLGNTLKKQEGRDARHLTRSDFIPNRYWVSMVPASIAAGASLPMLLEGLLHMPNLPIIVMLFPLAYATEIVVLLITCPLSRLRTPLPWKAMLIALASGLALYNEYRLMVPGLVWGITSVLAIGLSRACFVIGLERLGLQVESDIRFQATHGFYTLAVLFGFLFSGVSAYNLEHTHLIHPIGSWSTALAIVNLVSIVGAAFSGTFLLAYRPISLQDSELSFSTIPVSPHEIIASLGSSLLTSSISTYYYPTYTCGMQIALFLGAVALLIGLDQIHNFTLQLISNAKDQFNRLPANNSLGAPKPSRAITYSAAFVVIVALSWTLSSLSIASFDYLPPSLPAMLDLAYQPESKFEIVVSMYQESPASIRSMIEKIKSTNYLRTISSSKVRVIIYTKDEAADLDLLLRETRADKIYWLPNKGREGGTYLHHIVTSWDFLAAQTMFIQAHAHNMRELVPRIDSYLVPHTGMLSLGFPGVTCNCNSCGDRWGWEDEWGVVPTLYEKIYGASCEANQEITLSYKGQFVASAQRIRGVSKEVYDSLLRAITSDDGWAHNATILALGGNKEGTSLEGDNPSNPFFGFTVERIWGLLMQCGTDASVAARCPSLLSGMGVGGTVKDCQCLDRDK